VPGLHGAVTDPLGVLDLRRPLLTQGAQVELTLQHLAQ
jgi:hypothetical protein